MKKLAMYGSLALVLLLAATQFVMARPGNRNDGRQGQGGYRAESINWVQELSLTDEQITKIQGILQKYNTETEALYNTLHKTQTELRNLGWTKGYTEDKIKSLQETIEKTHAAIQASHQKMAEEIYAVLTDAQKKLYDEKGGCGSCPGCPGDGKGPGNGGGRKGRGGCRQP